MAGIIVTDGGAFLFPLTYVLGDVLAEVYGMRKARRAILIGFVLAGIASLTFWLVSVTPPAPGWHNQDAWAAVLGFVPRIVLASLLGYLAGQFLNAYVLVKIKQRTAERKLWARLIGSTLVGEAADTMVFCLVAFGGILTGSTLVNYVITGYVYKVLVEVIMLPVTYAVIKQVKKREPGYRVDTAAESVRQLRLVVRAEDYGRAVSFYRDHLGLPVEEQYAGEGGAEVIVLGAGRATLAVQPGAGGSDRSGRGGPHRGRPAAAGVLRGGRCRRADVAPGRRRGRGDRRADRDAVAFAQLPAERPRGSAGHHLQPELDRP